jgi:hypothetical protein
VADLPPLSCTTQHADHAHLVAFICSPKPFFLVAAPGGRLLCVAFSCFRYSSRDNRRLQQL